jgi:hypothetical protein
MRGMLRNGRGRPALIAAKPLAAAQVQASAVHRAGQISQRTLVMAVDALRRGHAERPRRRGQGRAHGEGDLRRGDVDVPRGAAWWHPVTSRQGRSWPVSRRKRAPPHVDVSLGATCVTWTNVMDFSEIDIHRDNHKDSFKGAACFSWQGN